MAQILLVDDSDSNRLVLSSLLEDEGLSVDTVSSFAEARALICASGADYDVVLLDQHLGDGLGTHLVPMLRERMPATKIMLISGSGGEEAIAAGVVLDASHVKGEDFEGLLAATRGLIAASRAARGSGRA
jgi:CheY-like chemotaxis protein